MNNLNRNLILLPVLLLVVVGCQVTKDEAAQFRTKNPVVAKYYTLEPCSPTAINYAAELYQHGILGIIDGVERRIDDREALMKFLKREREINSATNLFMGEYDKVKRLLEEGGSLYYFRWFGSRRPVYYGDEGLLILRKGKIVYPDSPPHTAIDRNQ